MLKLALALLMVTAQPALGDERSRAKSHLDFYGCASFGRINNADNANPSHGPLVSEYIVIGDENVGEGSFNSRRIPLGHFPDFSDRQPEAQRLVTICGNLEWDRYIDAVGTVFAESFGNDDISGRRVPAVHNGVVNHQITSVTLDGFHIPDGEIGTGLGAADPSRLVKRHQKQNDRTYAGDGGEHSGKSHQGLRSRVVEQPPWGGWARFAAVLIGWAFFIWLGFVRPTFDGRLKTRRQSAFDAALLGCTLTLFLPGWLWFCVEIAR